MTEAEWDQSPDAIHMVQFLIGNASQRKLRLFAVACCRRIGNWLTEDARRALDTAELFADGLVERVACKRARLSAFQAGWAGPPYSDQVAVHSVLIPARQAVFCALARRAAEASEYAARNSAAAFALFMANNQPGTMADWFRAEEWKRQSKLLRDIFGNPFRPVAADSTWLTANVVSLARAIYDGRAFDRLPILGDALEDAGCDNADILNHCRQPGEHVRGCWPVDLILAKE
jgi:hypothetical protein